MNIKSDTDVLRAKVIKIAQDSPEKFMETHFDPEKDYRVFILDALRSKNLTYKNSTFMYGKQAIGTNEEQVIVWLKENKDIFDFKLTDEEVTKINTDNDKGIRGCTFKPMFNDHNIFA